MELPHGHRPIGLNWVFKLKKNEARAVISTRLASSPRAMCSNRAAAAAAAASDLAGDVDTRSTSDGLCFYGSRLVSWHALKQKVVALSSCEAEYVAAITAATQAAWLAWLLGNFKGMDTDTVKLKIDNKSVLALIQNPIFHERNKHIDVRYHFIRECREDGRISADFVGTKDQLADIQIYK